MDVVRAIQLSMGDVGESYRRSWHGMGRLHGAKAITKQERDAYPAEKWFGWYADPNLNREWLRVLAMAGANAPPGLPERWAQKFPIRATMCTNSSSGPVAVTATVPRDPVAAALLDLDRKVTQRSLNRDSHWPLRMANCTPASRTRTRTCTPSWSRIADFGRPDHALFAQAKGFDRARAAAIFLGKIRADTACPLSEAVMQVLSALPPPEVAPVVPPLWGKAGYDGAIVQLLARRPEGRDRATLCKGSSRRSSRSWRRPSRPSSSFLWKRTARSCSVCCAWQSVPDTQKEFSRRPAPTASQRGRPAPPSGG